MHILLRILISFSKAIKNMHNFLIFEQNQLLAFGKLARLSQEIVNELKKLHGTLKKSHGATFYL